MHFIDNTSPVILDYYSSYNHTQILRELTLILFLEISSNNTVGIPKTTKSSSEEIQTISIYLLYFYTF